MLIVNFLDHDNVTAECYSGTLETLWRPFIAYGLCCCTKVYFTHQPDLQLVMALWLGHYGLLSLQACPVFSISWDPFRKTWLLSDLQQMLTFSFLAASLGTISYTFVQGIINKELIPEYIQSSAYSVSNQLVLLCSGLTECSFLLCLSTE